MSLKIYFKKTIISLLLILVLIGNMFTAPRVQAMDLVITPAIGAYLILGTALVACGVMISTDADFQAACSIGWSKMSDNLKNGLNAVADSMASAGSSIASFSSEQWTNFTGWVSEEFTYGQTALSGECLFPTFLSSANVSYKDYPIELSVPRYTVGTYDLPFSGGSVQYNIDTSHTEIVISLDSGVIFSQSNTSYNSATSGAKSVNFYYPIIIEHDTYNNLIFPLTLPIDSSTWHHYNFDQSKFTITGTGNSAIDGGTLFFLNGDVICTLNSHLYYFEGTYVSMGDFFYQTIVGGSSVAITVDGDYLPSVGVSAAVVPIDGSISMPVPTTSEGVIALTPDTVGVQTAVGSIANSIAIPDTNTTDDTSNKYKFSSIFLNKFPFCVPFDIYDSFTMLAATPVIPIFDYNFVIPSVGIDEHFIIDFEQFALLATITRWFFSAIFILILIVATRKLIKG